MKDRYEIYQSGNAVGEAYVVREGLYYRFVCSCRLSSCEIHKAILTCDGNEIDLGICVPKGEKFCLEKCLPIKRIGNGPFSFRIEQKNREVGWEFIPIASASPFPYISELESARFEKRDGSIGICLRR